MDNINSAFLEDFASQLEIDASSLTRDLILVKYETWDSLAKVNTIALIDQHFDILVETEKLLSCQSFGDILDLIC